MPGRTDESHIVDALRLLTDLVADIAYHLASNNPPVVHGTRYDDWIKTLTSVRAEVDAIRVRHDQPLKEERADLRREQGAP